ncbi:MAG: protease, partial [Bacteroidetes bacterium]|nr:protease [Bacteroidota bacterium]
MNKMRFVFSFVMLFPLLLTWGQEEARLMRFPTFFGDQVVFTYAGDLYTVPRSGGVARKITSDEGYEMFARFSPDGSQIAFTGQYDGNTEVYLIPATGGIPKRLTYTATLGRDDISDRMGPNNIVMTWKDNENIAFRSRKKSFNDFKGQLFLANVKGGIPQELPLPAGGFCSYSPDGAKLAYNQVFREFRTWKYYKGGMADDIRIYDFTSKTTENITNHDAQDIFPMWHGDNIYFCSDRDRTMNLFVYNLASKQTRKLTQFAEFDIKFPSLGNSGIIFENGGFLYIFDFRTEQITKLDIRIADDLITGRSEMKDASKSINSFTVSPDGKRVSFGARGDVWSVPVKSGITQNLTASPGVHNRNVAWSPDGKHIAYISDQTGEDELFMIQQDGLTEPVQITSGGDTYKYDIIWSPDSKKILWSDKKLRLLFVDIQSKEVTQVEQAADWEIRDYSWSPDSKWIAYAKPDRSAMTRLFLYSLATKSSTPVTDGWYDCGNPSFTDDGKYLFFASIRDFNPTYSWTEWNHAYQDMVKVYFLTLAKSTRNPLEPKNDEVAVEQESTEKETGKKEEKDKKEEPSKASKDLVVDMDGIIGRIVSLPFDPGAYWGINAIGEQVYYLRNASKDEKTLLLLYDLKEKKETELGSVDNYEISADKKKMLVASSRKYAVIDLPKGKVDIKDFIDLDNMKMMVDVKAEWNQIYNEAWRQMKYFFYDANMHGVNWDNIREKYKPLLGYVSNRNDLNYILGEMVGELNVGHAYVGGGDKVEPRKIKMGLLGAEITRDVSGFFRIDRILPGENWTSVARSPLTEVGVDVKEGDYIIAINRKPVKGV